MAGGKMIVTSLTYQLKQITGVFKIFLHSHVMVDAVQTTDCYGGRYRIVTETCDLRDRDSKSWTRRHHCKLQCTKHHSSIAQDQTYTNLHFQEFIGTMRHKQWSPEAPHNGTPGFVEEWGRKPT